MTMIFNFFYLAEAVADQPTASGAAISLPLLLITGFVATTTLGSVAWYNSKRPPGWEDKQRPEIVPEVDTEDAPGLGTPNQ